MMTTVGDSIPEMVLINSNNGSRAFRFEAGIFRLVCENGMIIKEADFGSIRQVHMGEFDLNPHIDQFVKNTLKTTNKVLQLQGIELDKENGRYRIEPATPESLVYSVRLGLIKRL